jgi:hypothetical protein
MEGTNAYLQTLEGSGRAVQGLADLLTERITPVYRKYAAAEGLGDDLTTLQPPRIAESFLS